MITAIVGAGGKTGCIFRKKEEYLRQNKTVLILTSTHMAIEEQTLVLKETMDETEMIERIQARLTKDGWVQAGVQAGKGKIGPLPAGIWNQAVRLADEVLVEADGSRHLPVKICNETEPVLNFAYDRLIVCIGMHGLQKPIKDSIHRYALWNLDPQEKTDAVLMQKILQTFYIPLMKGEDRLMPCNASNLYEQAVAEFLKENQDVSILNPDWFAPAAKVIILGAGHVGIQCAMLSRQLGFDTTIADDRKEFLENPQLEGCRCVAVDYGNLTDVLSENGIYIIVTRGHEADFLSARQILPTNFLYAGMIGSKTKVPKVKAQLLEAGIAPKKVESLHAPIGLKIHAITPAEIAVSIFAQIIEVKNTKSTSSASASLLKKQKDGTLCILLEKTGSSPRNTGSMMFVGRDGSLIDSIGGGILEAQAIEEAKQTTAIHTRTFIFDNTQAANLGMICGGSNVILFIPIFGEEGV